MKIEFRMLGDSGWSRTFDTDVFPAKGEIVAVQPPEDKAAAPMVVYDTWLEFAGEGGRMIATINYKRV